MTTAELKSFDFYGAIVDKNDAQLLMLEPIYRLTVCLSIGEINKIGADYFYVDVFNINYVKQNKFVLGSKSFVVDNDIDDIDDIENEIKIFVNSISGDDWNEILRKLRCYFNWEYEDHKFVS